MQPSFAGALKGTALALLVAASLRLSVPGKRRGGRIRAKNPPFEIECSRAFHRTMRSTLRHWRSDALQHANTRGLELKAPLARALLVMFVVFLKPSQARYARGDFASVRAIFKQVVGDAYW